jgi:hypothetical protein
MPAADRSDRGEAPQSQVILLEGNAFGMAAEPEGPDA